MAPAELPDGLLNRVRLEVDEEVVGWWKAVDVRSQAGAPPTPPPRGPSLWGGGRHRYVTGAPRTPVADGRLVMTDRRLEYFEVVAGDHAFEKDYALRYELLLDGLGAPQLQVDPTVPTHRVVLIGGLGFMMDDPVGAQQLLAVFQTRGEEMGGGDVTTASGAAPSGLQSAPLCPICRSPMSPEDGGWKCAEDGCEVFPH